MVKKTPYVSIVAALIVLVALMVFCGEAAQVQLSWNTPTTAADGIPLTDLPMIERLGRVTQPLDNSRQAILPGALDASPLHFGDQLLARVW